MKIRGWGDHHPWSRAVSSSFRRSLIVWALSPSFFACDPDVLIGARWGEWCATAPIQNSPALFANERGGVVIPPGRYDVVYDSGAQIHDPDVGYEVTDHYYGKESLRAGHHLFSGESPESSATQLWLTDEGLVFGGSIQEVEHAKIGRAHV